MARDGRMHACSDLIRSRRTAVELCRCNVNKCGKLREENVTLRENLRKFELYNEEVQPSKNDEVARSLVEPYIKLENDRYHMPIPEENKKLLTFRQTTIIMLLNILSLCVKML